MFTARLGKMICLIISCEITVSSNLAVMQQVTKKEHAVCLFSAALGDCRLWTADLQSVRNTVWDRGFVSVLEV